MIVNSNFTPLSNNLMIFIYNKVLRSIPRTGLPYIVLSFITPNRLQTVSSGSLIVDAATHVFESCSG